MGKCIMMLGKRFVSSSFYILSTKEIREDNFKREYDFFKSMAALCKPLLSEIYPSKIFSWVSQTPVIWGTILWGIFLIQETSSGEFPSNQV